MSRADLTDPSSALYQGPWAPWFLAQCRPQQPRTDGAQGGRREKGLCPYLCPSNSASHAIAPLAVSLMASP